MKKESRKSVAAYLILEKGVVALTKALETPELYEWSAKDITALENVVKNLRLTLLEMPLGGFLKDRVVSPGPKTTEKDMRLRPLRSRSYYVAENIDGTYDITNGNGGEKIRSSYSEGKTKGFLLINNPDHPFLLSDKPNNRRSRSLERNPQTFEGSAMFSEHISSAPHKEAGLSSLELNSSASIIETNFLSKTSLDFSINKNRDSFIYAHERVYRKGIRPQLKEDIGFNNLEDNVIDPEGGDE
jgi:hypothetical protein